MPSKSFYMAIMLCAVACFGYMLFSTFWAQVPLIPRAVLFNNPEKMCVRISPDGQTLAYVAPYKKAMNVWIRTIGENNDKPITQSTNHILEFYWAYNNQYILFTQDKDANERFHVYRTDVKTMETV